MPLSWNEIRDRATAFTKAWDGAASEQAEAQSFWNDFLQVFGVERRRVAVFEKKVAKFSGKPGRIDLFWPGVLLAEHKSAGRNLEAAFDQATDYFAELKPRETPRYVIVSDFARIRLYDLDEGHEIEIALAELPKTIKHFGFIAGYQVQQLKPEDPVNLKAAEKMGRLHDQLRDTGYTGHALELLLVRLLFCLFADDTGIFQPAQSFQEWLEARTAEDGSDLGGKLAEAFQVLNTAHASRLRTRDEQLAAFPYVNGKLFAEALPIAAFDTAMRETLLDACSLDWGKISPAIFGGLFQSIMDTKARRNLGAHYTSEANILKLIKPLFLDQLWAEFERIRHNRNKLFEFHKHLRTLNFLDPACGCGNFLVVAYRELRLLELELLRASRGSGQLDLDVHSLIALDVDQFHGIEIEEFPAQIAQVALWLTDHQMNLRVSEEFGLYFARIPLKSAANIVHGNALQLDWAEVVAPERLSYILGNPPFSGAMVMSDTARTDMKLVLSEVPGSGVLDFVACWYWLAAKLIAGTSVRCALVSTNSIVQGEQVTLLWQPIVERLGMSIQFAHQTFRWSNEARGVAAVHCVIVGFGSHPIKNPTLFEYASISAEPQMRTVERINPYLVEASTVFLENRKEPLCHVPAMRFGSMPRDGGHLVLDKEQRDNALATYPELEPFIRPYVGSRELLNGGDRYCLWLNDAPPSMLRNNKFLKDRISATQQFRAASKAAATRRFAEIPALFCQIAQPDSNYLMVPGVSSERRQFIPVELQPQHVIASNLVFVVPDASTYHLGVLSSTMHNAWMRYTCGRLESRYRYSRDIVYNNFPWPDPSARQRAAIETEAQGVLDAREQYPDATLADLYDPLSMPPALRKAHDRLDRAVDAAYSRRKFSSDAERVAFLFERYRELTASA